MAWDEAKKFILRTDPDKIDADLTDFPIMVRLAADAGMGGNDLTAIFDELGANNLKIAIFAGGDQSAGTQCYVEIEQWDTENELAALHVKVPSVSGTEETELQLYYDSTQADNTTYVGPVTSAAGQAVWDANFKGVYHLSTTPQSGTGYAKDSTSLGLHGNCGNLETTDLENGLAGKCITFDGSNEYIRVPYNAAQAPMAAITCEALAYKTDWQATRNERIISKTENGGYQLVYGQTAHKAEFALYRNGDYGRLYIDDSDIADGWAYLSGTFDGCYMVFRYNDGTIAGTDDAGGIYPIGYAYSNSFVIAAEPDSGSGIQGNYFLGKISEIRVSDVARSAAWLKATYYSLFDNLLQLEEATWSGVIFSNRSPAPDAKAQDGTPIKCDVTDNCYTFAEADIKISVKGIQYTSADPEVSYEDINDGKRIAWTPPTGYQYGRGATVTVRVDAKNSNDDEAYTQWNFSGKYFISQREAQTGFFFHSAGERAVPLLVIFRQAGARGAQLSLVFRRPAGSQEDATAQLIMAIRDHWLGTGSAEASSFICELKRIFGQGEANVAEVETLAGEASANIYGQYLVIGGGDANIQAFQIFIMPAGSGNIQVAIVRQGEASGNIPIPFRIGGEGSARLFKVEGTTYLRINALPDAIMQALQDAGIMINV